MIIFRVERDYFILYFQYYIIRIMSRTASPVDIAKSNVVAAGAEEELPETGNVDLAKSNVVAVGAEEELPQNGNVDVVAVVAEEELPESGNVDLAKNNVVAAGAKEELPETGNVDLLCSKINSPNNPYRSPSRRSPLAPTVRSHVATAVTTTASGVPITPISQLNLYQNNRWMIKARVTTKSDIRSWSNANGEGTLFSVELLDFSAVDIKAIFFKEAVDKFYGMLEVDRVYTFSGGWLKVANTKFNVCKCAYEISFDQKAEIHLADDSGEIQSQIFDFTKISDLETIEEGKSVDIFGCGEVCW